MALLSIQSVVSDSTKHKDHDIAGEYAWASIELQRDPKWPSDFKRTFEFPAQQVPMRFSATGGITAVVSSRCASQCSNTEKKFNYVSYDHLGDYETFVFKNKQHTNLGDGFYQVGFTGHRVEEYLSFLDKSSGNLKWRMIKPFPVFAIEAINDSNYHTMKLKSKETGVVGLGPYTENGGKFKEQNFMQALVDQKIIDHNIVSFNITFPKTTDTTGSTAGSYIYLGQISPKVSQYTTFLNSTDSNSFRPLLNHAFFQFGSQHADWALQESFGPTFSRSAIFDLEVDYMYVPREDFDI